MKDRSKKGSKALKGRRGSDQALLLKDTLQDSRQLLGRVLDSLSDAVFILDAATTEILECNPAACEVFGYSRCEMLGQTTAFLHVDATTLDEFRRHLYAAIEERGFLHQFQFSMKRNDGSVFPAEISVTPLIDEQGKRVGWVSLVRDISERKQAEKALRVSDSQYRALFEAVLDGIIVVDAETLTIVATNEAAPKMYGLGSVTDAIGMSVFDFVAPEERDHVVRAAKDVFEKGLSQPDRYRTVSKDGREIWVNASITRTEYGGRLAGLISLKDITEQKRAEEELQRKEEHFRALIENSSDAISIVDADGIIRYVSPSSGSVLGYVPGEEVGRSQLNQVHPDDTTKVSENFARLLQRPGDISHFQARVRARDGSWRVIEGVTKNLLQHPAVGGIVVNFRDITERRQAEEALRQSEEKYRLLADNVTDLIFVMDMEMKVTYINPSIKPVLGFSVEEGMAGGLAASLTPASLGLAAKDLQTALRGAKSRSGDFQDRRRVELEMYRKDGSTMWAESVVTVMRDSDGRPVGILGVTRDITDRKRAEQKLQQSLERETEARQKLEEELKKRVEFTRALVHELKTPLTSVIASSELLTLELPEGPLLKMSENINRGAQNLNTRIDELLDLARGELGMLHLNLTSVDPLALLRELAEEMNPVALSRHQSLALDLPSSLPEIWAEEKRLRQVVLNLLSNASKFTGGGGKITLKARKEGDTLIVTVEDTGPGIGEEEQQRLFLPYHRLMGDRERFSGLGLGLALSKTLVELHGGRIWVKSQKGLGSTFSFSVPLATESQLQGLE